MMSEKEKIVERKGGKHGRKTETKETDERA